MKNIKVGDRFILGGWEWVVDHINAPGETFKAKMTIWPESYTATLFPAEALERLDWIKEMPLFTKEQADKIKNGPHHFRPASCLYYVDADWLDEHTEK